jgi:20S proteasome alpha/beta subunit
MTVLAWDGITLAADRRANASGMPFSVTKIFRIEKGIVGIDGCMGEGLEIIEWLKQGADPEKYPSFQKDNERYVHALLIMNNKEIWRYERQPYPIIVEMPFFASGSGRDFAISAMAMGKTAKEAVELACRFDVYCGNGIDELNL